MNKALLKDALRLALHVEEYFLEELPANAARRAAAMSATMKTAAREVCEEELGGERSEKKTKVDIE